MFWRLSLPQRAYDLCKLLLLPEGLIISHDFSTPVVHVQQALYQQACYNGASPLMNTNVNLVMDRFTQELPVVQASWDAYTLHQDGHFIYSVAPIVLSLAILAVITWFLTIFVITNYTIKPLHILKASTIVASVFMLITVVKSIVVLHHQQTQGFLHGKLLLEKLNGATYLKIIDLFVVLLLQINQVQVIMRLFLRQSDKRLVFVSGVLLTVASQTLWSVSKFRNFGDNDEAWKIIPALTYLIRIALSITYATIFTAFLLTRIRTLLLYKSIWAISVLAVVLIYAPVVFFIADVSNPWIYELSEVFSVVTYVVCVVIPWEWCNKYNIVRRMVEKEGVLGRKFYEDEMYELDRMELFVEEELDTQSLTASMLLKPSSSSSAEHFSGTTTGSTLRAALLRTLARPAARILQPLGKTYSAIRDKFVQVTDIIIATGMAIPRSVSIGSSFINLPEHDLRFDMFHKRHEPRARPAEQTPGRSRHDVFVYSTRDVDVPVDK